MADWFTPRELAELRLPCLPQDDRSIRRIAKREGWQDRVNELGKPLARKRKGKGGAWEYHHRLLPKSATAILVQRGLLDATPVLETPDTPTSESLWAIFERADQFSKDIAKSRLDTVLRAAAHIKAGERAKSAEKAAARGHRGPMRDGSLKEGVSPRSVAEWRSIVRGNHKGNWLPLLMPKTRSGRPRDVEIPNDALDIVRSDWLRLEKPSFRSCFDRVMEIAPTRGWQFDHRNMRTFKNRVMESITLTQEVLGREGREALSRMYPPIKRDRSHFHALEAVNADGHLWDVNVQFEDGTIGRPMMLAIQDLYSGKILAWRMGRTENAVLVQMAFCDLFRDYGVPTDVYLDNGRAFSSKWITGGAEKRFRYKVKPQDPAGLLTEFKCNIHFTLPYSGQSKPIERAFRDLCDHVAKHPEFAGAWTGNSVANKPENYGERAVPYDKFLEVVSKGIALHNARKGRDTDVCKRIHSFNDVFEESYNASAIKRCSESQLRMAMLMSEALTVRKTDSCIHYLGNRYWSEWLPNFRGQKVVVRFDPEDLHKDIHVYALDMRYLGDISPLSIAGFNDVEAARDHNRRRKKWIKGEREQAAYLKNLTSADIAAMLPDSEPEKPIDAPKTVRLVPSAPRQSAALAQQEEFDVEAAWERGLKRIRPDLRLVEDED